MSFHGRLSDSMHDSLVRLDCGGFSPDHLGPLHNLPWQQASIAVDVAVEVAEHFIAEAVQRERQIVVQDLGGTFSPDVKNFTRPRKVDPVVDEGVAEPEHP